MTFLRFYLFSLWLLTDGHEAENVPGIGDGKFNMSGILTDACCGSVQEERLLLLNPSVGSPRSSRELAWPLPGSASSPVEHL